MSKEVRAVVLGLFVVVIAALVLSFWRGPSRDFQRIRGFKVEVTKRDGGESRNLAIHVPIGLLAQLSRLAKIDGTLDGDIRTSWDKGDITPREILGAAENSSDDKPGVIHKGDTTIEVRTHADSLVIDVKDEWDKRLHIQVPRSLVEVFADDRPLSFRDLLHRLDELDPGDVVNIRDRDSEITITAEPKKSGGFHIS
jgi:hypothetical protein